MRPPDFKPGEKRPRADFAMWDGCVFSTTSDLESPYVIKGGRTYVVYSDGSLGDDGPALRVYPRLERWFVKWADWSPWHPSKLRRQDPEGRKRAAQALSKYL